MTSLITDAIQNLLYQKMRKLKNSTLKWDTLQIAAFLYDYVADL